ncbi:hypothetical protein GCM10029964_014780 [Kibdelosporangium lantanae]
MTTVHTRHDSEVGSASITRDEAATARLAWEVAVDQLVQPGQAVITREGGGTELAPVHSLVEQVTHAVMPGNERNAKITGSASRPPASLGAVGLLAEVRQEVIRCCRGHDHPQPGELADRLRWWVAHAEDWQHTAPDYVLWAAEVATDWVRQARQLLDPSPRFTLRGRACPVCGTSTIQVWSDEEGDYVRRPALSIDPERVEAVCGDCGQCWGLDVWAQLAAAMDAALTHETLAVTAVTPESSG